MTDPAALASPYALLDRFSDQAGLQTADKHGCACPVNWQPGDKAIIVPAVSDEDAKKMFPQGWEAKKPYLRLVDVE